MTNPIPFLSLWTTYPSLYYSDVARLCCHDSPLVRRILLEWLQLIHHRHQHHYCLCLTPNYSNHSNNNPHTHTHTHTHTYSVENLSGPTSPSGIKPEDLTDDVFSYIFLAKELPSGVTTAIPAALLKSMREVRRCVAWALVFLYSYRAHVLSCCTEQLFDLLNCAVFIDDFFFSGGPLSI